MGVFVGEPQTTPAARCALKINWASKFIVQKEKDTKYKDDTFKLRHVVGIDTTGINVARTGVRGDNDLVWVGRAANYAAKLTELNEGFSTWITAAAYGRLDDSLKFGGNPRASMWEKRLWTPMNHQEIYGSSWTWKVD